MIVTDNSTVIAALNERITELERTVSHLKQVTYNVSKISFSEGAQYDGGNFHEEAIKFATLMHSEHTS